MNGRFTRRTFLRTATQGFAAAALTACVQPVQASAGDAAVSWSDERDAHSKPVLRQQEQPLPIPEATLETMVGQMLLIGFFGAEVAAESEIVDAARTGKIGGVVLFGGNVRGIDQMKSLTSTLQAAASTPLFVSLDQEGGLVSRLGSWAGLSSNHSAQYLGEVNNLNLTREQALSTGSILRDLGVNMNLAPVVDLNLNVWNPVIGGVRRAYSRNPDRVFEQAKTVIDAHREQGIVCTLKHFPGHGSSDGDTHLGFVDVTDSWQEIELSPYIQLMAAQEVDAIMSAHIFNARLDPDFPATLSHKVITGLLREQLGYQGVVISDDMRMRAISDIYEPADAVLRAVQAGIDIIAISNNIAGKRPISPREAYQILLDHVGTGLIPRERILQSYNRIMALKLKMGLVA
jgi:beta-N-acetylhexosaminidase